MNSSYMCSHFVGLAQCPVAVSTASGEHNDVST